MARTSSANTATVKTGETSSAKKEQRGISVLDKVKGWYNDLVKYLKSVRAEIKRVTWPTQTELKAATIVVLFTLLLVTLYLWAVNSVFGKVFEVLHRKFFQI
jgi:preprotein translocase subunit SecE